MHLPFSSSLEAYQIIWMLLTETSCVVLIIATIHVPISLDSSRVSAHTRVPAYKRFVPAVSTDQGCQKPCDMIQHLITYHRSGQFSDLANWLLHRLAALLTSYLLNELRTLMAIVCSTSSLSLAHNEQKTWQNLTIVMKVNAK